MPRPQFVRLTWVLLALVPAAAALRAGETRYFPERCRDGAALSYLGDVPVLTVQGTPAEIGRQYGVLPIETAAPLMALPKRILKEQGMGGAWPVAVKMAQTLFSRVAADHRRELDEMAKASGIDREVLVVANTLLELRRLGGCSTFIVQGRRSAAQGPLFGRNLDFPPMGVLDRLGLVTVVRPQGKHAFVSIGFPGLIGVLSGMNDAGLAVATLDVYRCKDGSPLFDPSGTPLTFCYRRVLEECATVREAEKLLRQVKPTTWSNLTVCDTQGGVVFELTPNHVVVRRPVDDALACTNHFRTPQLSVGVRCRRYAVFRQAMKAPQFTLRDVARLMHEVNQGENTIQTMIFEPAARRLHVALGRGPVSARPLNVLPLRPLLAGRPSGGTDRASPQPKEVKEP